MSLNVFSILPPRLGGLDMLIPMFMKIKEEEPNAHIEAVFIEPKCWSQLNRDPFLLDQLNQVIDRITILPYVGEKRWLQHFRLAVSFLWVLLRIFSSSSPIILHACIKKDRMISFVYNVAKLRGGVVFAHMNGLTILHGRVPKDKSSKVWDGDGFLCFREDDVPYLRAKGHRRFFPIGYPRLYEGWLKKVHSEGKHFVESEIQRMGLQAKNGIVTLYLGSTVPNIFELDELAEWLISCVKVIRKLLPDAGIILKPHPVQKLDHLTAVVEAINVPNIGISFLHPSLLAVASRVVISHHSSTIIDSLSLGIPTIQFQKFTNHWLKVHPEGSVFLEVGPLWAKDEKELEATLQQVLSDDYHMPNVGEKLHHKESLQVLFDKNLEALL